MKKKLKNLINGQPNNQKMSKKENFKVLQRKHWAWIKSLGVNINIKTGKIKPSNFAFEFPDLKVRNSIPTSDRIPGHCVKREILKPQLPAGKTISIAYNKGNYQLVDATDFKTMGRKV